ncbi:hypothetical protein STEG23_037407 [Scotinomys teguina]
MATQSKDDTLSSDSLSSHHVYGPERDTMGLEQEEYDKSMESWQSGENWGALAPTWNPEGDLTVEKKGAVGTRRQLLYRLQAPGTVSPPCSPATSVFPHISFDLVDMSIGFTAMELSIAFVFVGVSEFLTLEFSF